MKHQFFRLAFAQYLDGTDGKCSICNHKYIDIDDAMDRKVVCTSQDPPTVACFKCTTRFLKPGEPGQVLVCDENGKPGWVNIKEKEF